MKYKVIIFLFAVFTCEFSYSQATDSIVIDSTLTNSERLFTDSINAGLSYNLRSCLIQYILALFFNVFSLFLSKC